MADTASVTPATPAPSEIPKKASKKTASAGKKASKVKAAKPKAVRKPSTHPKISLMVDDAIGALNEKGGSSLKAIKKCIITKHKVDVEKLAPFIRRYLKSAVKTGFLIQAKGKGANGSFKLPQKGKPAMKSSPAPKKVVVKKAIIAASPKTKKPAAVRKSKKAKAATPTKKPKSGKSAAPKKKVSPKKTPVKKITKVKATKSPKPKAVAKKATTKKTAPKKK